MAFSQISSKLAIIDKTIYGLMTVNWVRIPDLCPEHVDIRSGHGLLSSYLSVFPFGRGCESWSNLMWVAAQDSTPVKLHMLFSRESKCMFRSVRRLGSWWLPICTYQQHTVCTWKSWPNHAVMRLVAQGDGDLCCVGLRSANHYHYCISHLLKLWCNRPMFTKS